MTFKQFNDMLRDRDSGCTHPFDVTGLQWRTRTTPRHIVITIDYRCPDCGQTVATSTRDIKRYPDEMSE